MFKTDKCTRDFAARSLFSLEVAVGSNYLKYFKVVCSNICWNSGRKYSNGGFVALARPTARVASAGGWKRVNGKKFGEGKIYFFQRNLVSSSLCFPRLSVCPGPKLRFEGFEEVSAAAPKPWQEKNFWRGGWFQMFWLIIHISSSLTAWEWWRQLLMLALTFIAQAWEGLLTPNLRQGASPSSQWWWCGRRLLERGWEGLGRAGKGWEGLTFTAQLTSRHLKLQLSNVSTLPSGIHLFGNV